MSSTNMNIDYETDRNLSIRAVKCTNFRWIPGMQTRDGDRILMVSGAEDLPKIARWRMAGEEPPFMKSVIWKFDAIGEEALPDLSDAGTLGCLLSLVRELTSDKDAYIERRAEGNYSGWMLWAKGKGFHADSEAEALVLALEITSKH